MAVAQEGVMPIPTGDRGLKADLLAAPVRREVFQEHPEAAFYIGIIATPGVIEDPSIYVATSKFRAGVYIDEMGFLGQESRGKHGGETDADDNRSVHFAVVENMGPEVPARVIGCSRLIMKDSVDAGSLLPVEHHFPEVFEEDPAPIGSSEGSRLIARHRSKAVQGMVALGLIRAMTAYAVENSREPVYAIVEKHLARMFGAMNLPFDELSEPKWLPEYNTPNMPLVIYPDQIIGSIRPEQHVTEERGMDQFFAGIDSHHGIGFFDRTLMKEVA